MKKKKLKKNFLNQKFTILLFVIFIIFILYYFFIHKFSKVETNYKKIEIWSDHKPKNITFYQSINLSKKLMEKFPEIKKINIKVDFFKNEIDLIIHKSNTIAKICYKEKCFYLDDSNEIISTSTCYLDNSCSRLITITSFLPIENNSILNPELTKILIPIFEYSNWKAFSIKEIKIYPNFDLGVVDYQNREFLFDPYKNINEQIKKLHLFLEYKFNGQRIDLRIPNKIYFK